MRNIPQLIIGFIGGLVGFLYGELSYALLALVTLSTIDFITGVLGAIANKELDSSLCYQGIVKKIFIFVLVAIAHIVDRICDSAVIMNAVIFFYMANEAISIIENAAKTGLPIPEKLLSILKQIKDKQEV